MQVLKNKNILVGVTGGIAAYKTAELAREFIKLSAHVRVVMTPASHQFVTPLTFETLTGERVLTTLFPAGKGGTAHIDWARWPDVIVVCPATANTIGKIARGIADNALTTTIMATKAPVIICPAMNREMYANPLYQTNQKILAKTGYHFVDPGQGSLACGEEGWGRLADKELIIDKVKTLLTKSDLQSKTILVTAGPTREYLDPVRFLSNPSSGKMGFAVAERAKCRGAEVVLVSGDTHLRPFSGVRFYKATSANDMAELVFKHIQDVDALVMAAAVSDYRPKEIKKEKIKKEPKISTLALTQNPDILYELSKNKTKVHVGFAVETKDEYNASLKKLNQKNLDFIVLNNPKHQGAAFQSDTNVVTVIDKEGNIEKYPLQSKLSVADKVLDKILKYL